jgi:hypothetical protein
MALAFVIEYHVGVTLHAISHIDSKSLIATVTGKPEQLTTAAILGTAVFIPYDGKTIRNTNKTREKAEDDVDIEIKILKDETCAILSPAPLIQEDAPAPHAGGKGGKTGTKAEEKGGRNDDRGNKPKDRLSYVRESKSGKHGRSTTPVRGHDSEREGEEVETIEEAMLGFDLRIFHPVRGEIKNDENVESLLKIEEKPMKDEQGMEKDGQLMIHADEEAEEERLPRLGEDDEDEDRRLDGSGRFSRGRASPRSPRKGPSISITGRGSHHRHSRYDDDNESVVESIVSTGEGGRGSFLRLDRNYYDSHGRRKGRGGDDMMVREEDDEDRFSELSAGPVVGGGDRIGGGRHGAMEARSSLYSHALNAKLKPSGPISSRAATGQQGELLPSSAGIEDSRLASKTVISLKGNDYYMRDITRGTKSRLNRYGVSDAIIDSSYSALQQQKGSHKGDYNMKKRIPFGSASKHAPIDLEEEIFDELCCHEINLQFVGYRPKISATASESAGSFAASFLTPRSIYFSYQFYTCAPTRTEPLKVIYPHGNDPNPGEVHVLVRDDPEVSRNEEAPLALRYIIDCSQSSPHEAVEFASYLAHKSLYVDVWDADGLLYLGTIGIPLRMIMRQGSAQIKQAIECDLINGEIAASSEGGVTLLTVAENGPVLGEIVGSISVILSNYGKEGKGPNRPPRKGDYSSASASSVRVPIEGLNWRAHGIDDYQHQRNNENQRNSQQKQASSRPKNAVRAKPLTETAPDLSKALTDLQSFSSPSQNRNLLSSGGSGKGTSTLNYDEISIIYRRFEGISKSSVQYAGPLMILMDLPSYPIAIKKLIRAYKSYADQSFFKEEILRFANSSEELRADDLEEMMKVIFEKTGVKSRPEERLLLAQKITAECLIPSSSHNRDDRGGFVKAKEVIAFIVSESDRYDWLIISKRLANCSSKAELDGIDVEVMLSDYDSNGKHAISMKQFRDFLTKLSLYGKLLPNDIVVACRHFSRLYRSKRNNRSFGGGGEGKEREEETERDRYETAVEKEEEISLKEVMAVLGKEYIGNIQQRIQHSLLSFFEKSEGNDEKEETKSKNRLKYIIRLFTNGNTTISEDGFYSYDQVEAVFRSLELFYDCITHSQFEEICKKLDKRKLKKLSIPQVLNYFGISFKASDLPSSGSSSTAGKLTLFV